MDLFFLGGERGDETSTRKNTRVNQFVTWKFNEENGGNNTYSVLTTSTYLYLYAIMAVIRFSWTLGSSQKPWLVALHKNAWDYLRTSSHWILWFLLVQLELRWDQGRRLGPQGFQHQTLWGLGNLSFFALKFGAANFTQKEEVPKCPDVVFFTKIFGPFSEIGSFLPSNSKTSWRRCRLSPVEHFHQEAILPMLRAASKHIELKLMVRPQFFCAGFRKDVWEDQSG